MQEGKEENSEAVDDSLHLSCEIKNHEHSFMRLAIKSH